MRFCLDHPEIFKVQLRAILRASDQRQRQDHVPDDLGPAMNCCEALAVLEECKRELRREGACPSAKPSKSAP